MASTISDDRGPSVIKLNVAMIVIATVAVGLRFWSRTITRISKFSRGKRFWWDDWLALANLPFSVGQNAVQIYWATIGLGEHVIEVPTERVTKGLITLYAGYFLYDFGISLAKLSALCFYARVFDVNNGRFRIAIWVTASLVFAWLLFAIPSAIFQCTPIKKAWSPTDPGTCLNNYKWWLGSAISSVIIDAIILILPMPILWKLQLKPSRKVVITCVFVAGYCVIVISIGRLVAVSRVGRTLEKDVTYNVIPIIYWLSVEAPISILSICLPSIFFLIKRGWQNGPYSLLSSRDGSSKSNAASQSWKVITDPNFHRDKEAVAGLQGHAMDTSWERLHERGPGYDATAFRAPSKRSSEQLSTEVDLAMESICVRQEIDVQVKQAT